MIFKLVSKNNNIPDDISFYIFVMALDLKLKNKQIIFQNVHSDIKKMCILLKYYNIAHPSVIQEQKRKVKWLSNIINLGMYWLE